LLLFELFQRGDQVAARGRLFIALLLGGLLMLYSFAASIGAAPALF